MQQLNSLVLQLRMCQFARDVDCMKYKGGGSVPWHSTKREGSVPWQHTKRGCRSLGMVPRVGNRYLGMMCISCFSHSRLVQKSDSVAWRLRMFRLEGHVLYAIDEVPVGIPGMYTHVQTPRCVCLCLSLCACAFWGYLASRDPCGSLKRLSSACSGMFVWGGIYTNVLTPRCVRK